MTDPRSWWADVPEDEPSNVSAVRWRLRDPENAPADLLPYREVVVTGVVAGDEPGGDPEGRGRAREVVIQPADFGAPAISADLVQFEAFYVVSTDDGFTADLDAAMNDLIARTR